MKAAILFLAVLTAALYAVEPTLDEQIAALQQAEPQKRYELMNAIKKRIATMNAEERSEAIAKLRTRMESQNPEAGVMTRQRLEQHSNDQVQQLNQQQRMRQTIQNPGINSPGSTIPRGPNR